MKLPQFDYASPRSLDEAIALLAANDGAKVLSGGQSLLPVMAFRLSYPSLLVDLRQIEGLDRITISDEGVRLGARVRWYDIEVNRELQSAHPLITEMISHVAHFQVRHRGTVGGSLAHADPSAEMPGLAVVCDCGIVVRGGGRAGYRRRRFLQGLARNRAPARRDHRRGSFPAVETAAPWGFRSSRADTVTSPLLALPRISISTRMDAWSSACRSDWRGRCAAAFADRRGVPERAAYDERGHNPSPERRAQLSQNHCRIFMRRPTIGPRCSAH